MSEGNGYGVNTTTLKKLVENHVGNTPVLIPHATYDPNEDTLEVIFEDCSYYEDSLPAEPIVVFRAMYGEPRAVGIRIHNWSQVKVVQSIPGAF